VTREVTYKFEQAARAVEAMNVATSREQFYDAATQFLTTVRAAVSVMQYQYGFKEYKHGEVISGTNRHTSLSAAETAKRKAFDTWYNGAAKPFLDHRLKADRDAELHRTGVSSIKFCLPQGSGLLLEPGNATDTPLALRAGKFGKTVVSLPLCGPEPRNYYFDFAPDRPAIDLCSEYLSMARALYSDAAPYL
jgi:hypothetical protein